MACQVTAENLCVMRWIKSQEAARGYFCQLRWLVLVYPCISGGWVTNWHFAPLPPPPSENVWTFFLSFRVTAQKLFWTLSILRNFSFRIPPKFGLQNCDVARSGHSTSKSSLPLRLLLVMRNSHQPPTPNPPQSEWLCLVCQCNDTLLGELKRREFTTFLTRRCQVHLWV